MYKLLCLDLDGTLLNENHKVSEDNKKAIIEALDTGIHVMLVSGRPNCFTSYLKTIIDTRIGQITFNGACFEVDGISNYTYFSKESISKIVAVVKKYDLPTYFKNRNEFFCTKEDVGLFDYETYNKEIPKEDRLHIQYHVNAENYIQENDLSLLKIFVREDDCADKVMQMAEELNEIDDIQIYRYRTAFEIAPKNASKGNAMKKVCELLNIKKEEVVSIGDYYNDISMFETSGLSIAMGNAPEEIKNICNETTLDYNHSGVAYAIHNYILK